MRRLLPQCPAATSAAAQLPRHFCHPQERQQGEDKVGKGPAGRMHRSQCRPGFVGSQDTATAGCRDLGQQIAVNCCSRRQFLGTRGGEHQVDGRCAAARMKHGRPDLTGGHRDSGLVTTRPDHAGKLAPTMELLLALGLLVATVSAIRGVWSPCGLSMLSSITPMTEAGRGNRFAVTARWFVVGGVVPLSGASS